MELERLHSRLKWFNKTPSPFSSSGVGKMCRGDREKWHRRWDLSSLRHVIQHSETQVALFHFQIIIFGLACTCCPFGSSTARI